MNTWEMLKELANEPQNRYGATMRFDPQNFEYSRQDFKVFLGENGVLCYTVKNYVDVQEMYADTDTGYGLPGIDIEILNKLEWSKTEQPVSWQEAIRAWYEDGKGFRVEVNGKVVFKQEAVLRLGLTGSNDLLKLGFNTSCFSNGKWYIE